MRAHGICSKDSRLLIWEGGKAELRRIYSPTHVLDGIDQLMQPPGDFHIDPDLARKEATEAFGRLPPD
jgi:hypothetical protein